MRSALALAAATILPRSAISHAPSPAGASIFRPEDFGAKGDGSTNDTAAFAAMSALINAAGGGTIELRPVTYLVGVQSRSPDRAAQYAYPPGLIMDFEGCRLALTIRGNGARLKCAPGLRYGVFDSRGVAAQFAMPNLRQPGNLATPYYQMIRVAQCSGPVLIENIELDGSLGDHLLGGGYGDTGRQIPATGIYLQDNLGDEIVRDVYTHHHALDGLMINGRDSRGAGANQPQRLIERVRSEYSARQGCSVIGGQGYSFRGCKFNHTGKASFTSGPGAGVDIEAEGGKTIRNLVFADCEFSDNSFAGMVADSGDSADVAFTNCRFVGTTAWAAWPAKPGFRFDDCHFVGATVRCFGDADPRRATQFRHCTFQDDPRLSPSGQVYLGNPAEGPIADLYTAQNILFDACRFVLTHQGLLPWTLGAIYQDCEMTQKSSTQAYPRGTFRGRNRITGNVDLTGSTFAGELILNGKLVRGGR